MKRLKTLRVRFALWTAGLLLVALLLFGLFVYTNMARSLTTTVDETLRPVVIQLTTEVELRGGELIVIENPIEDPEFAQLRDQGFSMRIFNLAGQPVFAYGPYQDLPQPQIDLTITDHSGEFATITDLATQDPVRLFTAPIVQEAGIVGVIQVAQNLKNVRRTLGLLLATLLIGGPLIVLMAGGFGYFLAARALAPIDEIIRTARHISAADLGARLNLPATEDEVGRLAATFDAMLARLEDAFRRERQFTADASHELRTPLAAMRAIIDSTITRQRTPAEYEQAFADLTQETDQMRRLTEGLLQLARNDVTQQPAKFEPLDLSILLKDVVDSLYPLAEDKGLRLIDNVPEKALFLQGDSDGLIRLFVNLLDNAIKYTEEGFVSISAKCNHDKWLTVMIRDTGIGIAPEDIPHIFDRFYRADGSRSKAGIGLGLAIAMDIARAHGGRITVESAVRNGSIFTVHLLAK